MDIEKELVENLVALNQQIQSLHSTARKLGVEPYELVDKRGMSILSPLLVAKAQVLHALTLTK